MVLCENRSEGFGPKSRLSSHLPTACFVDVIVVPLATWVYLVILFITLAFLLRSRTTPSTANRDMPASTIKDMSTTVIAETKQQPPPSTNRPRSLFWRVLQVVYYFLFAATVALFSLEIARLSSARLGVGLLPCTYIGLFTVLFLHVSADSGLPRRFRFEVIFGSNHDAEFKIRQQVVKYTNALFWVLLICTTALKIATGLVQEQVLDIRMARLSKYPVADEVADDAAMLAVEVILLVLELIGV